MNKIIHKNCFFNSIHGPMLHLKRRQMIFIWMHTNEGNQLFRCTALIASAILHMHEADIVSTDPLPDQPGVRVIESVSPTPKSQGRV